METGETRRDYLKVLREEKAQGFVTMREMQTAGSIGLSRCRRKDNKS